MMWDVFRHKAKKNLLMDMIMIKYTSVSTPFTILVPFFFIPHLKPEEKT